MNSSETRRIQRQRTKGWRMPQGAVYVGRPTIYGNPYSVEVVPNWPRWGGPRPWHVVDPVGQTWTPDEGTRPIVGRAAAERASRIRAAQKAVDLYREALRIFEPDDEFWAAIAGRDLACWCPLGEPCHADVLLELASRVTA